METTGNRFVCPNDRQLALRAKLKTGWSMKSLARHSSSTSSPIGADEQATIVNVIKRAEKLDINEQERVGKLVDRLEHMRRNALGRSPSQCFLCGEIFGVLRAQKLLCMDCRRLVCYKCVIERSALYKNRYLCMICAETREIWKKSGAWFFKSIPKYILPDEKNSVLKLRSSRMSFNSKTGFLEDDSSSDEDKKFWSKIQRRHSGTESTLDIHDPIQDQLPPMSSAKLTDPEPSVASLSLAEDTEEGDISRRESLMSRSLSEWNWSDDKVSPSTSSVGSSIFKGDETKVVDNSMGSIEMSLSYDPVTTTLHCTVYRAKNLIPMDINGLADPFCKLNILPNTKMSTRLRTKTVHKTRNPEFNENLTFYDITETDLMKKSLHVIVADDDKYGHDFMGETRINLAKLKVQNTIYMTVALEKLRVEQRGPNPSPELNQWFDNLWSRGQILLSLCYSTKRRALLVMVCRCNNLLPMDNNGFSDPFVKLQLKPDPNHRKHKTTIKWKNLNPIFNEEFAFETRPTELATQSLFITVYDKDYGKSNDYLGGLVLGGSGSKGQRLKHWLDMIRYPDHRHEAWHNLTDEILD